MCPSERHSLPGNREGETFQDMERKGLSGEN